MLARLRKATEENEEGFTLIELLVVMIIIGILAAIAIPVFLNQRKKAVDSSMKSDLRTVANTIETYYTEAQSYAKVATTGEGTFNIAGSGSDSVTLSKGNKVSITPSTDGYCIVISRTSGSSAASQDWVYKSDNGGVQAAGVTSCAAAAPAPTTGG